MGVKTTMQPEIKRKKQRLLGDTSRVITRRHIPDGLHRIHNIIKRVAALPDNMVENILAQIMIDFSTRHKDIKRAFEQSLNEIEKFIPPDIVLSDKKRTLVGAYFTMEYSIESAALFNPSIVLHPDQSYLEKGSLRFIMSLRAIGEGHVSSIVFRSGVLDRENTFKLDPISNYVERPDVRLNPVYDRRLFLLKLNEMEVCDEVTSYILDQLPEDFTYSELKEKLDRLHEKSLFPEERRNRTIEIINWLASSNYEVGFRPDHRISERVIFPVSENESSGIEDARFVQFFNNNGEMTYYATYTAYNGITILPQLIETKDFVKFKIITLNGKAVKNKGMALFPRKIDGRYVMLSRQDGENNHIMYSDNIHFWQESKIMQEPEHYWEFFQIGNCGSP
ncbi:MAG: glycosidase, partial [Desulfobacteraceae bacterium]